MRRLSLALAAPLALSACDPTGGDTGGVDCDTMFTYAVTVDLVDVDGAPFVDDAAAVEYAVDDESGDCQSISAGTWGCGVEAGGYAITAAADGYAGSVEVEVLDSMCGAVSVDAELTLYALD